MVLVEVSGNGCDHIDREESQKHFAQYLREELGNFVGVSFTPNTHLDLPNKEHFLVKAFVDVVNLPSDRLAEMIAGCCNAAFVCGRCPQERLTRCVILEPTHIRHISVSTSKIRQSTYA